MPTMTLHDVPDDMHAWLKLQAEAHHRSVSKEVIVLLESLQGGVGASRKRASVEEIMSIGRRVASARELHSRSDNEIIGYDKNGIPG